MTEGVFRRGPLLPCRGVLGQSARSSLPNSPPDCPAGCATAPHPLDAVVGFSSCWFSPRPYHLCWKLRRAGPQFAMVALPRYRLHCSLAHWASGSLSRSGASWGSPPVRRCQTVHRTVRLAAPPLLTHRQRSPCSTVRNRRAASLPLASLVAHWASASLPRPLDAVGVGPISSRWLKDRPGRTENRGYKQNEHPMSGCSLCWYPAATYSPGPSPAKYHRRLRA